MAEGQGEGWREVERGRDKHTDLGRCGMMEEKVQDREERKGELEQCGQPGRRD